MRTQLRQNCWWWGKRWSLRTDCWIEHRVVRGHGGGTAWKGGTELEGTLWEGERRLKLEFWPGPNESALKWSAGLYFLASGNIVESFWATKCRSSSHRCAPSGRVIWLPVQKKLSRRKIIRPKLGQPLWEERGGAKRNGRSRIQRTELSRAQVPGE